MKEYDIYEDCYKEKTFYTMTDSQLGIFLDSSKNPESDIYNIPYCCTIPKKFNIDINKLKQAIRKVIEGYPFMKVNIDIQNGEPVIVRNDSLQYTIPVKQEQEIEINLIKKTFVIPFDLSKGPLFRFEIIETDENIYLLFDFHHMIADAASINIFLNRLSDAYGGKELETEKINSFILCNYEEKIKGSLSYQKSKNYFKKLLMDKEVDSNIIYDKQEDRTTSNRPFNTIKFSLKDRLNITKTVNTLKKHGLRENALFLGAFSYALAKYTGQDESLFCTVSNGRYNPGLENTMGMLVRTLPVYTKFNEEARSYDYLKEVQDAFFETMRNEQYSFAEMSKYYGIKKDIVYNYLGDGLKEFDLNGNKIPLEFIERNSGISNIAMLVYKKDQSYELAFEYRTDLYKQKTIESFAKMIIQIVDGLIKGMRLKDITLVSQGDLDDYGLFNKNTIDYDRNITVVDMFHSQVEKNPENLAVVFKDKTFTYHELNEISEQLAIYLKEKGVKKGTPVAIMINRSEMMAICPLGILKAGGVYQPIDANYPRERISHMLKDSGTNILITDYELKEFIPEFHGEILYTKDIEKLPVGKSTNLPKPIGEDLFVLLYTSGSTGMPKGCMIEHRNISNSCLVYQNKFQITQDDISAAYSSFSFDASLVDFYPYLTKGACVHIIPEEIRFNMEKIDHYYRQNKISMAVFTTQLGRQYVSEYGDNPYLKALIVGGEKLVPCEPPSFGFYNGYGPTECTVMVSSFKVDKKYTTVPVGKPIANCDIYILDKYNRLLPIGVPGELCVAGYQVSRGYFNREDLTKEKFISNPYSNQAGYETIYKTGDICRYLTDGNIEFIGRRDFQVKIRGFRIELTEIEEKIRQYKAVKDSTVIAKDLPSGGKSIVAYIVGDEKIDINTLREFISKELPHYMVPSDIMQIESIPLNQNCKVDKKKLPEIKYKNNTQQLTIRPLTMLEKQLTEMISDILGHTDFGIDSNLIYRGLNSLTTIKLGSLISKKYGYSPDVKQMMKHCSIIYLQDEIQKYLLEAHVEAHQKGKMEKNKNQEKKKTRYYPLSHSQRGIYYESMKRPNDTIYNIPTITKLPQKLDIQMFKKAVETVLKAHPYISTHLKVVDMDVMQQRNDNKDIDIKYIKIKEEEFNELKRGFVKPFDLFEGPLYRVMLVETENVKYLLMDFHHIIFDGISYQLLFQEISKAYEGERIDGEDYSYYEYVEQELEVDTDKYREAEDYFKLKLKDFETASEIPSDLNGKEEQGKTGESIRTVDRNAVNKFCQENGITPAHLFLAGTVYTIARFTSSDDVYISTITNGRTNLKTQNSFGMFVKTIPLSINIGRRKSVLEFLKECRKTMIDSIYHDSYPFDKVLQKYDFSPQIMYACQLDILDKVFIDGEQVYKETLNSGTPKFKISVNIEDRNDKIAVCIYYNDEIYSKSIMNIFSDAIATSVENIMTNTNKKIREISLVSKTQEEILKKFNKGKKIEIGEKLLHKRFERQATLYPNKKALIACDREYTFEELNKQTNKIANALINYGVNHGEAVAILLPRDSRLIASMYGILKAGGVYVPCDTEYPIQRIDYILEDSDATYIITTANRISEFEEGRAIDVEELMALQDESNPQVDIKPTDLAYLIYTSGSTGKPKGVMLEHRGISNCVFSHPEANVHVHALVEDASTILSVTTIAFDLATQEIAIALCNGMTLVLADENQANDPILLAKLFSKTKADAFNTTPSRLLQYLEIDVLCECFKNCKVIMCGGEKYPDNLLEKLQSFNNIRIFNGYGPTEITVGSNVKELTKQKRITTGPPLHNYKEFIVDSDGNELPIGVVGELYISGQMISRGYKNLKKLTEERFIEYKGMRAYKSGDYAKWTEDGEVIILGRTDNQIKLRGLRIELGEIESSILKYDSINNVVVIIKKINSVEHICAYFSASEVISIKRLKQYLSSILTSYMIPTAFLQMDELPMTLNGKIDIKSLPKPMLLTSGEYIEPRNQTEKIFCNIFSKVLELPRVGATDNFFELGGTSLVVTSVVIEATKQNVGINYGDIFSHPTPRELASLIQREESENVCKRDELEDISKYEYEQIQSILNDNTLQNFKNGEKQEIGNILLTGSTGFLGIHILEEFLNTEQGIAYCLIRHKENMSSQNRLKSMLDYYFKKDYNIQFKDRIIVLDGDITDKKTFDQLYDLPIDTVINCAANVKHFSKDTDIEDVNVGGVKNIVDFCLKKGSRLVQISTVSTAGFNVRQALASDISMDEQMLYFGQNLDNKYCHSKFLAERIILEKIPEGLSAKIMRVGNLSGRDKDGKFQINFDTNSFVGRLKAFLIVGKFPYKLMDEAVEMSPIDFTAKSILLLAKTPKECSIFHPYNNHKVKMGTIIKQMKCMNMDIQLSELEDYEVALSHAKEDNEKAKVLSSIIAYQNIEYGKDIASIPPNNFYTLQVLYRMGFQWSILSNEYIKKFLLSLYTLGFFDKGQ